MQKVISAIPVYQNVQNKERKLHLDCTCPGHDNDFPSHIPDFLRKKLKKRAPKVGAQGQDEPTPEEKVWEILMNADKKDYERICVEYGITNFRGMLKKLKQMKQDQDIIDTAEFVSHIDTLKHIEEDDDEASIDLDLELKELNSKIFLYKDREMVAFTKEECDEIKHSLNQVGKKHDSMLYSMDVEGGTVFTADFKVPDVDFAIKLQEIKADERQDALFVCVLTAPLNEIKWFGKNAVLSNGEKFEISVSEDKLIHKLIVRDCLPLDAGIYAAVAGIKSCNAWLVVEADKEASSKGKKAARKNTIAGLGDDEDLLRIAKEQQEKYQKEMEERLEIAKKAQSERDAAEEAARLEAQAAKKRSDETKAAAKVAAKAKKAEEGVDESVSFQVAAHVDVEELSEDNEEAGQNSLFMETVEVDKVTSGDSPPLQDKVKGNDHGEETAVKQKGERCGTNEKRPKVKTVDAEDAAVGNHHGEETAEQSSEKSGTKENCPKEKIGDVKDTHVESDKGDEEEEEEEEQPTAGKRVRIRQGPLIEETIIDSRGCICALCAFMLTILLAFRILTEDECVEDNHLNQHNGHHRVCGLWTEAVTPVQEQAL